MIARGARSRAGITLTEILISIMIMGIGLVSLATLFPLGLMRLRAAAIRSRSAYLTQSAVADMAARNLLSKESFFEPTSPWYGPPNFTGYGPPFGTTASFDPWVQDTPLPSSATSIPNGAYRGWGGIGFPLDFTPGANPVAPEQPLKPGPGLPVMYDPLWRAVVDNATDLAAGGKGTYPSRTFEARFAVGYGIRNDPNSGGTEASAHGLQRITNFNPFNFILDTRGTNPTLYETNYNTIFLPKVASLFVSPDDIIFQAPDEGTGSNTAKGVGSASPIVPDMSGGLVNDWTYTWAFTGQRSDATNGSVYQGDIVIFQGRPLAIDTVPGITVPVVAGEPVVEAVFGYSQNVDGTGTTGYGIAADRVVLLRWPATVADPEIKTGSWIADVTYERFAQRDFDRQNDVFSDGDTVYPNQRCHWYQVVKHAPAEVAEAFDGDLAGGYRSMTVVVGSPLRSRTPLFRDNAKRGHPWHVNVALISRYVVNVFPKTFYAR